MTGRSLIINISLNADSRKYVPVFSDTGVRTPAAPVNPSRAAPALTTGILCARDETAGSR
jgi:hypothetical protein